MNEIAARLPVSRPAVSQHLRVLERAGLVSVRREGTRRVYRLEPGWVDALRAYLDTFWSAALAQFAEAAERNERREDMTEVETVSAPVRKRVRVACDIDHAFQTFTEGIESWWPVETHSITAGPTALIPPEQVVFEQKADGRCTRSRRTAASARGRPARLRAPEPHRARVEGEPGRARRRRSRSCFPDDGDGTVVELEHRGWERYPGGGDPERAYYDSGWPGVLGLLRGGRRGSS